jgi:hypothetical protein
MEELIASARPVSTTEENDLGVGAPTDPLDKRGGSIDLNASIGSPRSHAPLKDLINENEEALQSESEGANEESGAALYDEWWSDEEFISMLGSTPPDSITDGGRGDLEGKISLESLKVATEDITPSEEDKAIEEGASIGNVKDAKGSVYGDQC